MRRLKGASLLEAIVAAVLFMTVFVAVMELLPRLTVRDDDALLVAEAEYRVENALTKYGTGLWPCEEYRKEYDWGVIIVKIEQHKVLKDIQIISITGDIEGSRKKINIRSCVKWAK